MNKLYYALYHSPIGQLILVSDDNHLLRLYPKHLTEDVFSLSTEEPSPISLTQAWLDAYFNGDKPPIDSLPIKTIGTAFQEKCWRLLLQIPYGSVTTYKDIANQLQKDSPSGKMSCQAVGQAIRKNPITIIIPCHRVIGSDDSLTGYSGGLTIKKELLHHEAKTKAAP